MRYKRKHEHGTNHLEVMCRMKPGEQYTLTWQWRYDNARDHWKRAAKKGYFRKHSARGTDTFTRTNKAFIEGDTLKRSIAFSWPDITAAPPHIRSILQQSAKLSTE
jgi:hypothetical protein